MVSRSQDICPAALLYTFAASLLELLGGHGTDGFEPPAERDQHHADFFSRPTSWVHVT